MKSRLFVVDSNTLISTQTSNIVSIIMPQPTGTQWIKTLADIMADMLQVEIGDYIFLWETGTVSQKSRIHGVYRAISKPFYLCTTPKDNAPFKIHIEKAYDFTEPIDEYDVLNNPYIKNTLWTIIGKKVAGKSRGTSPLSIEEAKNLITLLIGKNPGYAFIPDNTTRHIAIANPLQVSYTLVGKTPKPANRNAINPNSVAFFESNYNVKYEKVLETIFNQEFANHNAAFFAQLGINVDAVKWYCNYLPYSIEQSEMDYVVLEAEDKENISKSFVIEFIKNPLDEAHIHRALMYSKWLNDTLELGCSIAQPVIICKSSVDFIHGESAVTKIAKINRLTPIIQAFEREYNTKELQIYEYNFRTTPATFIRKR